MFCLKHLALIIMFQIVWKNDNSCIIFSISEQHVPVPVSLEKSVCTVFELILFVRSSEICTVCWSHLYMVFPRLKQSEYEDYNFLYDYSSCTPISSIC